MFFCVFSANFKCIKGYCIWGIWYQGRSPLIFVVNCTLWCINGWNPVISMENEGHNMMHLQQRYRLQGDVPITSADIWFYEDDRALPFWLNLRIAHLYKWNRDILLWTGFFKLSGLSGLGLNLVSLRFKHTKVSLFFIEVHAYEYNLFSLVKERFVIFVFTNLFKGIFSAFHLKLDHINVVVCFNG